MARALTLLLAGTFTAFLFVAIDDGHDDGPRGYPLVPLVKIATGKYDRPRATVEGVVTLVKHEEDGDWHFRVEADGHFLVCEIVPELPQKPPRKGQRVSVSGIVRFDGHGGHGWWELHPCISWKEVK